MTDPALDAARRDEVARLQTEANPSTAQVLADIAAERLRQDAKWGVQRHVMLPPYLPAGSREMALGWAEKEAARAKETVDGDAAAAPDDVLCSWDHILAEEYLEARVEMLKGDMAALRAELVQVAAVAVNMIETIDEGRA